MPSKTAAAPVIALPPAAVAPTAKPKPHKVSTEELEQRLAELSATFERHLERAEKRLTGHIHKVIKAARGAKAHAATVKELVHGDLLEQARADADSIHGIYRVANLKVTVATETVFLARVKASDPNLARNLALAATLAFDLPDPWWQEREHHTLAQWAQTLTGILRDGLPHIPAAADASDPAEDETEEEAL